MHSSLFLVAALASSTLAVPVHSWAEWNTTSIPSSIPSSILTGVTRETTTVPTSKPIITTDATGNKTSPHSHHSSKPPRTSVLTTYTTTDYITTTKFIPCSTPVGTQGGKTYYSTFLTTEVWTTTSCYPVTSPIVPTAPAKTTPAPAPQPPTTTPAPAPPVTTPAGCPAASTVTVTEYPGGAAGGYYPPGKCSTCQTITYTDVWGYVITIAVPKNPWTSETSARTSTTSTSTSTSTPHGTGKWSSKTKPTGTGNLSTSTTTTTPAGTGKWTPKSPQAYPTGSW